MNDNIQLKMKLLNLLEERYKKDPNFFVNKSTISVELGITEEEAFRYADYLVNNKWVTVSEPQTSRWRIMITEEGRKELERIRNVIVEAKKNNTNEQFGDAKLSKIEEKIKDVNLEKIPSEKSEPPQRTQKENPKVILQAYLIELKKAKEARNAHSVQRVGERLLEFVKKLQLTHVESAQLNDELVAMINMSFGQRRSNMLSTDQKSLNELFDKYVAKYIDKVIYVVETLIDLPKEITLRKKPLPVEKKKSWFSKLFSSKQKNPQMLEESLEIPIDNFQGIFNVFISHKFVKSDQKLALELRKELRKNQIEGYLAESTREYELLIGEKIRDAIDKSEYMVGIITEQSQTSASFNQELGYALGIKKPIVIMIEKGVQHGVLTHGRETEEFTRKIFENACQNVTKYIKENNVKKKSQKNQFMNKKVYSSLYNAIMKLNTDKIFLEDKLEDPWNAIDYSEKLKVDYKIRELFEKLSDEIKQWNNMSREREREFQYKQNKVGDVFKECFDKVELLKKDGYIILTDTISQEPSKWVQAFKQVLLDDPDIKDSENLYKKLYAHAILRDDEHSIWLKRFKQRTPKLFDYIYEQIPHARHVMESEVQEKAISFQKNKIKYSVQLLKNELEEKLK